MSCFAAQKIDDRFNGSVEPEVVSDHMRLWQLQLRRAIIIECNDPWACSAMSYGDRFTSIPSTAQLSGLYVSLLHGYNGDSHPL